MSAGVSHGCISASRIHTNNNIIQMLYIIIIDLTQRIYILGIFYRINQEYIRILFLYYTSVH